RRGLAQHQLNRPGLAVEDLDKAISIDPENPDFWYSRGNCHAGQGNVDAAIADYRNAVECDADHSAAWYNYGNMLFGQGRFEEAIESWDRTIAIQPDLFRAYNNRAAAHVQLGQLHQAQEDYEKTLQLNPAFARAYDNFAWLLATSEDPKFRDPERAIMHAQKACELTDHQDWSHLSTLAASYAEAGDFANAGKWLKQAHSLAPDEQKEQLTQLVQVYDAELAKSVAARQRASQPRVRL
ncbi:MAG: tetratricopeptide repeat protein, partial [Fuerstiella sp.]